MPNKYLIPEEDVREIRKRDKKCVYCRNEMKEYLNTKGTPGDKATIEHLNNDGPFDEKPFIAICCGSCNSSRGNKELLDWFKGAYCRERQINQETVAEPVKEYLRYIENFINKYPWTFAKTMPEIPHYYIVRENLSDNDKKVFDDFGIFIKKNGYVGMFGSKEYHYLNIGIYKYWVIDDILNRDIR